jgi:hypothetical protein
MDALQEPSYSSGQAIGVAQTSRKPQFGRYLCETSSRASSFKHHQGATDEQRLNTLVVAIHRISAASPRSL